MTSQYDTLLAEAKLRGSGLAKELIPRLYKELVEVEKLDPKDAGERIKKDLVDTWSPVTIRTNLPEEAKHMEKDRTEKPHSQIVLEQSIDGSSTEVSPQKNDDNKYIGDVLEQYKEVETARKQDYDKLADEYNQAQERLEGLQTHNDYLQNEIDGLKQAVQALQPNVIATVQATNKVQPQARNPNRGYWIRFDLSNTEITRPLINIIMRMKDRPKQFYFEILGDDVIDVSETKQ